LNTYISKQKKLEKCKNTKFEETRAIIDGIDDLLFVMDKNRVITEVNKSTCQFFKKKPEELLGKHCFEIVHGTNSPWPDCPATKTYETKQSLTKEIIDPNCGVPFLVTTSPVLDEQSEVAQIIHIAKDITSIKQTEMERHLAASLFDAVSDSILVHDMGGKILFFNEAAYKTRGYTRDEFQGLCIQDLAKPGNPTFFGTQIKQMLENGESTFETANLRKDKKVLPVEVHARIIESEDRKMVLSVARDISERKKVEHAANVSLKRYQSFIEVTGELGWTTNPVGEVLEDIPSFRRFTGQNYDEVKGCGWTRHIHPDDVERVMRVWQTAVATKTKYEVEYRLRRFDGIYRNFMARGIPIFEENGEIREWIGSCIDITERIEAGEKLAKLKEFDERIIDSLDDALLVIDPDNFQIIKTNEPALKQLKLAKEEVIGKTCYGITHHSSTPCNSRDHVCPIRKVLETKETITVEHKHLYENNSERIVEVSARFVKNPEAKPVVIHVARDITERKQMETRIREAEERYRALFDQAPIGILLIDAETAVPVEFNKVAHEQLGYSREEFAKLRIFDYKAIETPNETKARIEKILLEGRTEFETKHRTKNGGIRDIVATSQVIELSGKKYVHSIYLDVTEEKKTERALMESEAKYRQLVELAQEGVWALDDRNFTVFVNPRIANMLGYTESEMIGKNLATFLGTPNSDIASRNLEACKLGRKGQCEFDFVKKDGTHLYANIAASTIQDDNGNYVGTLALVADITERKKIEINLKISHDKLEMMNEKLRVVGSLTRHDVRNKLSAVTGYAYLLKKRHTDQTDIMDGMSKMELAVAESVKIFDFAKMYEQLGLEDLTYIDVGSKLKEAVTLFSGTLPKINNECHGLTILADSFLRQLFFNFIDNTRKYGKKTTTIRAHYERTDQDSLKLVYEDDGVGVPVENKTYLFKEGFSTGGSTGFGLFLTKKMMDVYGWKIEENGEPGKGAKFTITIPKLNSNGKENYQISQ
jgi:PAS domain S-box-containing protein